jgi:hypothetical protein
MRFFSFGYLDDPVSSMNFYPFLILCNVFLDSAPKRMV